jgi:hypothetical protein
MNHWRLLRVTWKPIIARKFLCEFRVQALQGKQEEVSTLKKVGSRKYKIQKTLAFSSRFSLTLHCLVSMQSPKTIILSQFLVRHASSGLVEMKIHSSRLRTKASALDDGSHY